VVTTIVPVSLFVSGHVSPSILTNTTTLSWLRARAGMIYSTTHPISTSFDSPAHSLGLYFLGTQFLHNIGLGGNPQATYVRNMPSLNIQILPDANATSPWRTAFRIRTYTSYITCELVNLAGTILRLICSDVCESGVH
jgi:hypothetical protein